MWKMYWKFLILSSICIFGIFGQDVASHENEPQIFNEQTKTTESSTTTTEPPTTTTEPPTTSTEPSTTTTEPSTTTSVPSTTSKPTTAIPTVEPTPAVPNVTYDVVDKDKKVCIRLMAGIQFDIKYESKNFKYNMNPNVTEVSKDSTCNGPNDTQIMILEDDEHILTITFAQNKDSTYVRNVSLSVPEIPHFTFDGTSEYFSVSINNSYLCKDESDIKLDGNATIHFYELQLQAFMHGEKGFLKAEECSADNDDKMSNVVPIAVAIALLSLVVLILIGYLITRRRTHKKQYQSM